MSTRHLAAWLARIALMIEAQQREHPGYGEQTLATIIDRELAELAKEEAARAKETHERQKSV